MCLSLSLGKVGQGYMYQTSTFLKIFNIILHFVTGKCIVIVLLSLPIIQCYSSVHNYVIEFFFYQNFLFSLQVLYFWNCPSIQRHSPNFSSVCVFRLPVFLLPWGRSFLDSVLPAPLWLMHSFISHLFFRLNIKSWNPYSLAKFIHNFNSVFLYNKIYYKHVSVVL